MIISIYIKRIVYCLLSHNVIRHRIIRADLFGQAFNLIAPEGMVIGADMTRVVFAPDKINVFADDWRVAAQGAV